MPTQAMTTRSPRPGATASTCRASRHERVRGPMSTADLIVTNLAELVTCAPALGEGARGGITRGAIAAAGGRIVWVGPESRLAAEVGAVPGAQRIDGRGAVGLPGFVDSHTHAIFAGSREAEYALRARGASYQEIAAAGGGILSTVRATRAASRDDLVELALPRLMTVLAHGTTTIEIKSGYGLTTADELKMLAAARRLAELQPVEVHPTFCGVRVALASDFNPGSSMGPNLQLVMTMAVSQMKMSPEEALLGVTLHGACAMGLEQEVGSLRPGKQCDLLLADVPNWRDLSYVYGVNHVTRVLKRGKVVHPSGERRSDMPNAAESRLVSGQARSVPAPRPPLP